LKLHALKYKSATCFEQAYHDKPIR
jgi:hypothetical protein